MRTELKAVSNMFGGSYPFDYIGTPIKWHCADCSMTITLKPPRAGWDNGVFYTPEEVDDIATYLVIDSRKDHYSPYCWDSCDAMDRPHGELS